MKQLSGQIGIKQLFALISALLLVFSFVQAAEQQTMDQKRMDSAVKSLEGSEIPSPLGKYIGNSKMNVELTLGSGEKITYGIITADKKIATVVPGGINNPSLNIYATEQAVKDIQAADDPAAELQKSLREKEISWEGVGFFNKVKYSFAAMSFNLGRLFSSDSSKESAKVVSKELAQGETLNEPQEESAVKESSGASEPEEKASGSGITGGVIADETEEAEEKQTAEHIIKMTENGFVPEKLTIQAGDTVKWENERTGKLSKAMIIGTRSCINIKSGVFSTGESFSWTFDKEGTCTIVDGIMIKKVIDITIE